MPTTEYAKNHDWAMTVLRSFTIAPLKKATIIYMLFFLLASLLLAYLVTMNSEWEVGYQTRQILFVISFLAIGTGHIFSFSKWISHLYSQEEQSIDLSYTLLMAVICGLATYLLFKLTGYKKPQLSLAASCSFLLPFAIVQGFKYFVAIPPKVYEPWVLPSVNRSKNQIAILLNGIEITIKIKVNYFDLKEGAFPFTVPGSVQLGVIFHRFLLDMEKDDIKIRIKDEQGQPYSWVFSLQTHFGNRVLDPDLTLTENKIRQKSTLFIERIKI